MQTHYHQISQEFQVSTKQVASVAEMLDEGSTVPFISRYRKERTGSLDEVAIASIRDRIGQLRDMQKRREYILKIIEEQGNLDTDLKNQIESASTMSELEDLYLPYKPKRRTKATIAREKGLEPLAKLIFEQKSDNPRQESHRFLNKEKEVLTIEDALDGARDIIAEWINENQEIRRQIRRLFSKKGIITSKVIKGKDSEGQKYKDYFKWSEEILKVPSHRLLAMRRGEKELILSIEISPDEQDAIGILERHFVRSRNQSGDQVRMSCQDSYKRLLKPSMETEIRLSSKEKADIEAIRVFAENLKPLLLAAPLGQKNVMAIDPGFRTGCKVVCLSKQGKLLKFEAIFPNEPQKNEAAAGKTIIHLVNQHNIEAIAIGNGTAGRETERFIKALNLPPSIIVAMVNESGASIYSASDIAREEFPDQDITVRGAVSIGRRLMDPLAELVKIDAKSIGVGQYQHDVDQSALKNSLDDVVTSCVNSVGVELNTASRELLTYVSGLGPQLAQNIVTHRNQNGPFKQRNDLKKVPRLGGKAFEQAAGFLRIRNGADELDNSAVHPERYPLVKEMAKAVSCTIRELITDTSKRSEINLQEYVDGDVGLPTLEDILSELSKPGRDPRDLFETFAFDDSINEIGDLKLGMRVPGIITNVTKFGAFVDIGVHQDGLIHISQIADRYIADPGEIVKINQKVNAVIIEVDVARKRISLSLKNNPLPKN